MLEKKGRQEWRVGMKLRPRADTMSPRFTLKKSTGRFADITPLVDMVFLLLIFFIISSRFLKPVIAVDLPKAGSGEQSDTNSIVVSVDQQAGIFLEGEPIQLSQLSAKLKIALQSRDGSVVILEADGKSSFAHIVKVMDEIRIAGATVLNIAHQPQNSAPIKASPAK